MNDIWEKPIAYLKGVGPRRAEVLQKEAGIATYRDLAYYFPRKYLDRTQLTPIEQLSASEGHVVLRGKLGKWDIVSSRQGPILRNTLFDGTGWVELLWFHRWEWVKEKYESSSEVLAIGRPQKEGRVYRLVHPELMRINSHQEVGKHLRLLAVYPETEKLRRAHLDSKGFRMLFEELYKQTGFQMRDPIPEFIVDDYQLMPLSAALFHMHLPQSVQESQKALYRFKFEELFYSQLLLWQRKVLLKSNFQAPPFEKVGTYFNTFYDKHLPFTLTDAQKRVIKEIRNDLRQATPMNRLVQGDVGSGKTIVALLVSLIALDNGYQVALMAPTEVLAEQHYRNFQRLLASLMVPVGFLGGGVKPSQKKILYAQLKTGELPIVVGTHALIQPQVEFAKLGLVIIDEQHKFGVLQRASLAEKADPLRPHVLLMTATPIPRTLALTLYGDADISVIDQLPPGRSPVKTQIFFESQRLRAWHLLRKEIEQGRQAYVIYPLIEESEKLDIQAAEEGYKAIKAAFPEYHIGLLHGRLSAEKKEYEMLCFKNHKTQILVSTTVIEVGIDVPNATLMIIENAERFGLSQLHQLRGRVGRGAHQSHCFLMTHDNISQEAYTRLKTLVEYHDGFKISEVDLRLRGPGDFLGTKQSGLPEFRIADIVEDREILHKARQAAQKLIESDRYLTSYPYLRAILKAWSQRAQVEFFTV
ncbi:MAG: ATP-dependent DNA helicase RecG [Bacteroidia bacterium]